MFQTALVYAFMFLDHPNKVTISEDVRSGIYIYGDSSVYIYVYTYIFIYVCVCNVCICAHVYACAPVCMCI